MHFLDQIVQWNSHVIASVQFLIFSPLFILISFMMSEICFLDPDAQVNNEGGDAPGPRHISSFVHKSSAFPLWFGFRKLAALLCYLSLHTSGRQCDLTGRRGVGIGFPGQCQSLTLQFQANPSLSDSFNPLFSSQFKSIF